MLLAFMQHFKFENSIFDTGYYNPEKVDAIWQTNLGSLLPCLTGFKHTPSLLLHTTGSIFCLFQGCRETI